MAAASSTSSSKSPAACGKPWALLLALLIIAGVEVGLHRIPRMHLIAYSSLEGQYHAVRDIIDANGPAEVALVGSSQMREGVSMPVLIDKVRRLNGSRVPIANYALRGARVDVMDAVVRYLQSRKNPPKLIIVGVSARDLRATDPDWPRMAIFWRPTDWWREFHKSGWRMTDYLPIVIRNEVAEVSDTLRYREEISLKIQRCFKRFGVNASEEPNPILGQETMQNSGALGLRTLEHAKIPLHKIRDSARESYLLNRKPSPLPAMMNRLKSLAAQLGRGHNAGLFVEMPVADYLQVLLNSSKQAKAFQHAMAAIVSTSHVPYIPAQQELFKPTRADFTDMQHLNRAGSVAFAKWLARPLWKMLIGKPPTTGPAATSQSGRPS